MVCIAAGAFFLYAYRMWFGYGIEAAAPATLFAAILMGMCLGFLPHNIHPARIFMGDSGSMLIGLVLAAGAVSITGQVDPDRIAYQAGSVRSAVHAMVPVYMPILLPLTIIAVPVADLVLAVVRRTLSGQSPFAADRGHLHHRLLEIGHSHSRAVMIMYFWSALIAFGAVLYSVHSASMWLVFVIVVLSFVGLVLLLMPRFTPRAPLWAQSVVPPRYRWRTVPAAAPGAVPAPAGARQDAGPEAGVAVVPGEGADGPGPVPPGVNGATAIGARSRFTDRRKAGTPR
jgi:UDP-GlcNAc:undecaprenyl-phosphate GlcNAc-1-phosphate transferase